MVSQQSFSTSHYIPIDKITYDIINEAAERRREHAKRLGIHVYDDDLYIDTDHVFMTYEEDINMGHFIADVNSAIDQTSTHLLITLQSIRGTRTYLYLIDKRTGQYFTTDAHYIYNIPELLLGLIRVYGQTQKSLICECLKNYLLKIYLRDEREEKKNKPIQEIINNALDPYYDARMWISAEQARRFKEWIENVN